jgi:hypothetical protein
LEAFNIRQRKLGEKHRETLNSLSQMARAYLDLKKFREAEESLLKVKDVYALIKSDTKRSLSPFEYGRIHSRLGALGFILGRDWERVLNDYREGLNILVGNVGNSFHFTTEIRNELGIVEAVAALNGHGTWTTAWDDLMKGSKNYLDFLGSILSAGTRTEHRTVLARQRRGLDQLLSLAKDYENEITQQQLDDLFSVVLSYQAASSRIIFWSGTKNCS